MILDDNLVSKETIDDVNDKIQETKDNLYRDINVTEEKLQEASESMIEKIDNFRKEYLYDIDILSKTLEEHNNHITRLLVTILALNIWIVIFMIILWLL